jgi:hypothetical protein
VLAARLAVGLIVTVLPEKVTCEVSVAVMSVTPPLSG